MPCLHTFCEACLSDYIPAHSLAVSCPLCRQQSILPEQGVAALQNNHFIINLMAALGQHQPCDDCSNVVASAKCTQCQKYMCEPCAQTHPQTDDVMNGDDGSAAADCSAMNGDVTKRLHDIVSLETAAVSNGGSLDKMSSLVCPSHNGLSLEYYCSNCETAVCETCTSGEHSTHVTIALTDAILEHKETLNTLLERTKSQIPDMTRAIRLAEQVAESLTTNYHQAEIAATQAFDELALLFEQRKQALLAEITTAYEHKYNTLTSQVERLRQVLSNMRSCCAFTEKALQCGNETEVSARALYVLSQSRFAFHVLFVDKISSAYCIIVRSHYMIDDSTRQKRASIHTVYCVTTRCCWCARR